MQKKTKAIENARATYARLRTLHPEAHCELDHGTAFQLLVATVLSAQTTDVLVNKVTPHLFERFPDALALAAADQETVMEILRTRGLGMYRQKSKNICGLARLIVERHGGEVPRTLSELIELPGVGRKTANVVLGVAFGTPEGIVVDTHVQRLSQRLGWTQETTPEKIEQDLCQLFPRTDWDMLSHTLIFHGRRVCFARKPACAGCGVNDLCPSAFNAENVGRKSSGRGAKPVATKTAAAPTARGAKPVATKTAAAPAARGVKSKATKTVPAPVARVAQKRKTARV